MSSSPPWIFHFSNCFPRERENVIEEKGKERKKKTQTDREKKEEKNLLFEGLFGSSESINPLFFSTSSSLSIYPIFSLLIETQ